VPGTGHDGLLGPKDLETSLVAPMEREFRVPAIAAQHGEIEDDIIERAWA
jgi:hypothetical protein